MKEKFKVYLWTDLLTAQNNQYTAHEGPTKLMFSIKRNEKKKRCQNKDIKDQATLLWQLKVQEQGFKAYEST